MLYTYPTVSPRARLRAPLTLYRSHFVGLTTWPTIEFLTTARLFLKCYVLVANFQMQPCKVEAAVATLGGGAEAKIEVEVMFACKPTCAICAKL